MFEAIALRSTPKGGFGNRLLNYINLRQLSSHLGVPFLLPNKPDRSWIKGVHRPATLPWRFRTLRRFSAHEVLEPDFLRVAREDLEAGKTLILKPRLLTEALARFDFLPAKSLVRHRFDFCESHRQSHPNGAPVVLHLRGTDFVDWKPGAILGEEYYREALDWLDQHGYSDSPVRICTEDVEHHALPGLRDLLDRSGRLVATQCTSPFECDYAAIIQAERVVSSPSTFAITASLLGGSSAIHSRKWVDSRIEAGEVFWTKIRNNTLNGHQVIAEL